MSRRRRFLTLMAGKDKQVIAAGGDVQDVTIDGINYRVHTFTTSGDFVVTSGGKIEYMIVAGGGAGGRSLATAEGGGGGGAGGYLKYVKGEAHNNSNQISVESQTFPVTVGAGGVAGNPSTNGGNSSFAGLTAIGGGRGAGRGSHALSGGSGGGGSTRNNVSFLGGQGTSPQGFKGGDVIGRQLGDNTTGAGGGGALAAGNNSELFSGIALNGGDGVPTLITGEIKHFAGGGGGADSSVGGTPPVGEGGIGGGGNGAELSGSPTSGAVNTGGGGGGGNNGEGADGGSGIVIIRYRLF